MSQQNFPILNTASKDLQLIQANIQKTVANIQQSPFIGGNYLKDIVITAGTPAVINHKLGQQPQIWSVGDIDTNSVIWRTAWDQNSITLNASATCTIALWVN